jgi:hypothetical protein
MFIAALSLVTSMYNGYLNNRFLDFIERNTGRVEYLHTCKEIIDAYFQVKFRASGERTAGAQREVEDAVSRFAALATYLANLRDDKVRARYTELARDLGRIAQVVGRTAPADIEKLFQAPDRIFAELNDDCVKRAKDAPM